MSTTTHAGPAARTDRLLAGIEAAGADLMLVTDLMSVRYLTGYTGSNGLAIVGPGVRLFATDFRYQEQVATQVDPSYERRIVSQSLIETIADLLPAGSHTLAYDDVHTSVAGLRRLEELVPDGTSLRGTAGLVEALRRVKEPEEIALIAASQQIADDAFSAVLAGGILGRTEWEVALALEFEMRSRGASGASFDSIVGAGPHGALPHGTPRDVPIRSGDLVVIDWGAFADGYGSDCTRTVAVGSVSSRQREVYEIVAAAQLAGLDAVRAGADARAVDQTVRELITGAGYGENYGHGLGHGVGLAIHEAPTLSYRTAPGSETLATGEVVTVEPGIYLPGEFGVRIEDLVVVTDGAPTILTSISKELTIVD